MFRFAMPLALLSFCAVPALAATVSAEFTQTISNTGFVTQAPATARLDLTLNGNGTITASLNGVDGKKFRGFGVDSPEFYLQDVITDSATSWGTSFGNFDTGWFDYNSPAFSSVTWTFSKTTGSFASVSELYGGTESDWDFFLFTEDYREWAANAGEAEPPAAIPLPEGAPLLLAGLGGLAILARKRRDA